MPSPAVSRRRLLRVSSLALVGLAGCLSASDSSAPSTNSPPLSPTTATTEAEASSGDETSGPGETSVASLAVADFVLYPLAGTHPHVHRQADTQYVVVRLTTSKSRDSVRDSLTLALDGEPMPLAERQPNPWEHETVDLAFAVPKSETFDRGRVAFDGTELRALSTQTVQRLNNPPMFEISNLSAAPDEIRAGERGTATVAFDLANTGEERGTFGASLKGNLVSGSTTVTATLDNGASREIEASTEIVGQDDEATVRVDWGSDEWSTGIPVVGTETPDDTETGTPSS